MRLRLRVLALAFGGLVLSGRLDAATITVTGIGDTIAVDGVVTLREAMTSANTNADANADVTAHRTGSYGADTIVFAISPGSPPFSIGIEAALPEITGTLTIDGTTQPGFVDKPVVELDGSVAGASVNGLKVSANDCVIKGLVINRFNGTGIYLNFGFANATIQGNFIGVDTAGTTALGNGNYGISVFSTNPLIGGTAGASSRNVISGNVNSGILEGGGASGVVIQGNYIGTNAQGTAGLMNGGAGGGGGIEVNVTSAATTIGGTTAGAGNLISGNSPYGIRVSNNPSAGTTIQGNLIGTNAAGTAAIPNTFAQIGLSGSPNNVVGGTSAAARNVIGGAGFTQIGIEISGPGALLNVVQGNIIGTDASGTVSLGFGNGIKMTSGRSTIGGTVAGAGNTIANCSKGIVVSGVTSVRNAIEGNSISGSTQLGIDLGDNGVTANDAAPDGDAGPNNLQNFPVISSATVDAGTTTIAGSLTSALATTYRLELFANPACHSSGYGEGRTYLGFVDATTDGAGSALFSFPVAQDLLGQCIAATATDPNGNTSEFSLGVVVTCASDTSAPVVAPPSSAAVTQTLCN